MKYAIPSLGAGVLALLFMIGCASEPPAPYPMNSQVPTVPTYRSQPPPAFAPQPVPSANPAAANTGATSPVSGTQAPAPGQAEAFPTSPGPDYIWMPSYWTTSVRGDWVWIGGHYVARQGLPDEQLRAARGMLEQARGNLTGKPLKKVNNAIDQINDALQIQ